MVQEVEEVFLALDTAITTFKQETNLGCKSGCGRCCLKPDIEATILEFIPFAYDLYKQDKALEWLEKSSLSDSLCAILDPSQFGVGHCTQYDKRGLICRLFGFSARINKYGHQELMTCQVIKTEQSAAYLAAYAAAIAGGQVPLMRDYYMKLHGISWELTQKFYPINEAIRNAIETVMHYYSYREDVDVVS